MVAELKIFQGNSDQNSLRRHDLDHLFLAKAVRIHPVTHYRDLCLRFELLGCNVIGEYLTSLSKKIAVQYFSTSSCTTYFEELVYNIFIETVQTKNILHVLY